VSSEKIKKRKVTKVITKRLRLSNAMNQIAAKLNSGQSLDRVGIKIIADDNKILHKIYEALGK